MTDTFAVPSGAPTGVIPPRASVARQLQIVTTRGQIPNSKYSDGSTTRAESRKQYFLGSQAVSQIQVLHSAIVLLFGGTGEQSIGNDLVFETALEIDTPQVGTVNFWKDGVKLVTAQNGANPFTIGYHGISAPAGGYLFVRNGCTVASAGQSLPSCDRADGGSAQSYISAAGTSQIPNTGALTLPGGGSARTDGFSPVAILGVPAGPMPAVIILGDSIADGVGDSGDGNGNYGYVARGLWSVSGYPVPWSKQTVTGALVSRSYLPFGSRSRTVWPYATHLFNNLCINDVSNGVALATIQQGLYNIWASAKRTIGPYGRPMQVAQALVGPATTSTDSFATAANQTHRANFAPGGLRDQLNAWILSQVGQGVLDAAINQNAYLEDPQSPGKWITNGTANYATADGLHPSTAGHVLAAQAVNAWALTLTV